VDQKCRPHRGHTQNWSGFHAPSGAGSFISICSPHRWHAILRSIVGIREF
jgi:hypothetical protein